MLYFLKKASCGARTQSVTVCVCVQHDWLWVRSPLEKMKYSFKFILLFLPSRQGAALSYATQYEMPAEFGGKWGTDCLNTRI